MNNSNAMGFSFSSLFSSKEKIDPSKLSIDRLKDKAKQGLRFYYAASRKQGLQGSFDEFIAYIDELHPTYRKHLGTMLYNAENSLGTEAVNELMEKLGEESQGKIFTDPADLQIFGDVMVGELSNPSILTMSKWVADSVQKTATDIASYVNKLKYPLIIGGVVAASLIGYLVLKKKIG